MATKVEHLTPLVDIQSAEFAKHYENGAWWRMHGDKQGKGPLSVRYLVTNLRAYEERSYFNKSDPCCLEHLGFFIGMYHGSILSLQTGQLRSNMTTLALLDHHDARRGYCVGREWYFHEAGPEERRLNEQDVIARLRELVTENPYQQGNNAGTWYYGIGCLLGELSGQLFPETQAERQVWEEEYRTWETEQRQQASVLKSSTTLQEA